MKIVRKDVVQVSFDKILVGNCFMYKETLYFKIRMMDGHNTINLDSNEITSFSPATLVISYSHAELVLGEAG